jgi:adenylate kinase
MSDEGEDHEEEPELVEPPKGKHFFISNINSFVGQSLVEELRNDDQVQDEISVHKFVGTESDHENAAVPDGVAKIVKRDKTRAFRKQILDSDIVIYDLVTADFDEVDHVIKTFKTSDYEEDKVLVLISSVMTWVNTPPKVKKENEEEADPEEGAEPEELTEPDENDPDPEPVEGEET